MFKFPTILAFLAFFKNVIGSTGPYLKLTSDGPVILDATISFRAELWGADDYEPPFYFSWGKKFYYFYF